jgi:hypothetical protein
MKASSDTLTSTWGNPWKLAFVIALSVLFNGPFAIAQNEGMLETPVTDGEQQVLVPVDEATVQSMFRHENSSGMTGPGSPDAWKSRQGTPTDAGLAKPPKKRLLRKIKEGEGNGFARLLDYSGQFTYEIPDDWACTSNPFLPHDILTRQSGESGKTISFQNRKGRFNPLEIKKTLETEYSSKLEKFKLLEASQFKLESGKMDALKFVASGEIEKIGVRQVCIARPYKMGQYLLVIGNAPLDDKEPMDQVLTRVASRIEILKHPTKSEKK